MRFIIRETEKAVGIFALVVGACGMDSANLLYPVAIMIAGAGLTYLGMREGR